MNRKRFPLIAEEFRLREDFNLEFVSHGPTAKGWEGTYLKCPHCNAFVLKGGGNYACPCGNLVIDSDMLRIEVRKGPESAVDTYNVIPK